MNTTLSLLFEYGASFQSHVATHLFGTRINGPSTCSLISPAANMCKLTVAIMLMKVGMGHKQKNGVSSNCIWEFWLGRTKDGLLRNSTWQTVLGIWVADAVPNGICISKYEWLMVQLTRNLYWVLVVVGMANRICSGSKYGWPIVQPIGYLVLGISMCWYS